MKRLLRFLWRHPLVWIVPALTYGVLLVYLVQKLANAPQDAFDYRIGAASLPDEDHLA